MLTLRALAKGIIKLDEDMGSKKVGNLEQGEVFRVLEQGEGRVRMWRGWVSVTSANGQQLLAASEELAHAEQEAAPDPQPAASPPPWSSEVRARAPPRPSEPQGM